MCEIYVIAGQHDFLTGSVGDHLGFHRENRLDHWQHLQGFTPAARWFRLAKESELFAKLAEFFGLAGHAGCYTLYCAKQIDQDRHVAGRAIGAHRVFKQHSRSAFGEEPGLNFRHFEHGRDRLGDTAQLSVSFKLLYKIAQTGKCHLFFTLRTRNNTGAQLFSTLLGGFGKPIAAER